MGRPHLHPVPVTPGKFRCGQRQVWGPDGGGGVRHGGGGEGFWLPGTCTPDGKQLLRGEAWGLDAWVPSLLMEESMA